MGQFIDELNISQSELFDNAGLDEIPIKVFFRRHDRTGRGRSSDGTWSRKEQRLARTELSKLMSRHEPARCIRRLLPFCDSLGNDDRKIQEQEFFDCLDPSVLKMRKLPSNSYRTYFEKLTPKPAG